MCVCLLCCTNSCLPAEALHRNVWTVVTHWWCTLHASKAIAGQAVGSPGLHPLRSWLLAWVALRRAGNLQACVTRPEAACTGAGKRQHRHNSATTRLRPSTATAALLGCWLSAFEAPKGTNRSPQTASNREKECAAIAMRRQPVLTNPAATRARSSLSGRRTGKMGKAATCEKPDRQASTQAPRQAGPCHHMAGPARAAALGISGF